MGYQFIHINSYARIGSVQNRTNKHGVVTQMRKWSAQDIADEAERKAGACDHVEEPAPPQLLHGVMPSKAVKMAEDWAAASKDAKGRKMRSDGLCLLAGVVSMPRERERDWDRYKRAVVHRLQAHYGSRLVSVVEHTDERHPHLHFYVVPRLGESFDAVHPGRQAAAQKAKQGEKKGVQNRAYQEAMRQFQDWFSEAVANDFGLARLGPARRRLTRDAWRAEVEMGKLLTKQQVSVDATITVDDITPMPTGKTMFGLKKTESQQEVVDRLNEQMRNKIAPLSRATHSAKSLASENQRLAAENEKMRSAKEVVDAMTRDELAAVYLRKQEQEQKAKQEAETKRRIEQIPALRKVRAGAAGVYLEIANDYLKSGQEQSEEAWRKIEYRAIIEAIGAHGMSADEVAQAVLDHSPARYKKDADEVQKLSERIKKDMLLIRQTYANRRSDPSDDETLKPQ